MGQAWAMTDPRMHIMASESPEAQTARMRLEKLYGSAPMDRADLFLVLGGDGFMLHTLHALMERGLSHPVYGMNRGTVGFLLNPYHEDDLPARIAAAKRADIHPLRMEALTVSGERRTELAINEVSLLRQTVQAARLSIRIDGQTRVAELIADGVLLATPAGSTAYNFSAHGPILPLDANALALTPISPFRPRRWRGAILPRRARCVIDILDAAKRPVSASADYVEVRNVAQVSIHEARDVALTLLYDADHALDERILAEQFAP